MTTINVDSVEEFRLITNGGKAPNVVPDFAEVYYYARHNDMRVLDDIWERISNAAKGAALGTGTTVSRRALMTRASRTMSCAVGSTCPSGGRRRIHSVAPSETT